MKNFVPLSNDENAIALNPNSIFAISKPYESTQEIEQESGEKTIKTVWAVQVHRLGDQFPTVHLAVNFLEQQEAMDFYAQVTGLGSVENVPNIRH